MPKRRILIVDDEPDVRTILRATLAPHYEVVEAQDGLDAAQKLDVVEPDFVILDVMMPLMDGFETCRVIRSQPRWKEIPVLFLTALSSKKDIVTGYEAGANLYLTKPFDPARLLRVVQHFFEEKNLPYQRKKYTVEEIQNLEHAESVEYASARARANAEAASVGPTAAPSPEPKESAGAPQEKAWYEGKRVVGRAETEEAERQKQAEMRARAMSPRPPRPRVLVVDDEEDLTAICAIALEGEFEVATANDGIQAVEKITLYEPDIIVLDAMLPKMSGYQLCQSLRRNCRFKRTPIIMISGKSSPRDREYALRLGATDFLAKPFSAEDLVTRLKTLISQPGFQIHPKSISGEQMVAEEKRRRELEEREDKFLRKQESELEKFLRENQ